MSTRNKILIGMSFAFLAGAPLGAMAASQAAINGAIDNGLGYLSSQQTAGGYWNYGGYEQAATGAASFAMLEQKARWGANAATYQTQVDNAIAYLLSTATVATVSTRSDGVNICPGAAASCKGVYWYGNGETTYTTGQVAMAIAQYGKLKGTSTVATMSGPLAGMTWGQISQGIVNTFSAGQTATGGNSRNGGWRYFPGTQDSDMSTTQWAVLAMTYGETLGAVTPQAVRNLLPNFLGQTQAANGAGCYQPSTQPCESADTGGLLLSLSFLGKSTSDPAVQHALTYLNSQWQTGANGTWYGNFGHPYAMWAEYKGLETTIGLGDTTTITNLLPGNCGGDAPIACNWWQDYNNWLVDHQNGNGSWGGYGYWTGVLATAYDLPILSGTQVPTSVPEPATVGLLALGLGMVALAKRRRTPR